MGILKEFQTGSLCTKIFDTRKNMGNAAGKDIAKTIRTLLSEKDETNMIFAAAPSQNETLEALINEEGIDWSRINAFHMDEYIGLCENAPQRFGNYLYDHIFSKVNFKSVNYINGSVENIEKECNRYTALLKEHPIDIVCLGIGENGHIAFNDPWVADFNDSAVIKKVELDSVCRNQQVNDGCFDTIKAVPTHALTLTIPTLVGADYMFCSVPANTKADAAYKTINNAITEDVPATIMRTHKNAIMYLDSESGRLLL